MTSVMTVRDLALTRDDAPYSFDVHPGLTLVETSRESGGSTLSMALAGRYNPASGRVLLHGAETSTRQRFAQVALAGVPLIDALERSASVREVLREQIAWAQPFFARVPRDVLGHRFVSPWLAPLGLDSLDPGCRVGELHTRDRMRLRVLLALVGRREASLLVVDDPDQLRSRALRNDLLNDLKAVSRELPVLVTSVNPDPAGIADSFLDLTVDRDARARVGVEAEVNS